MTPMWRVLWSAIRPVAGWLLALAGAVALFLGWYGVSGTPIPAKQLPYLVSGGLTGVALVVLAAAVLASADTRRQIVELREVARKVDHLYDLLTEPEPDEHVVPTVVEGGATWHRPGCPLVAGKPARAATEKELATLRPCRVCGSAA